MNRNPEIEKRMNIARGLAEGIDASVRSIAVVGSVSSGLADEDSDIEIELFTEGIPSLEERVETIDRLGGRNISHYAAPLKDGSVWSMFEYGEGWIELGWQDESHAMTIIDELARGEHSDHDLLLVASTYGRAVWLRSSPALKSAVEGIGKPSEDLAGRIIKESLKQWDLALAWQARRTLARRNDRLPLAQRHVADLHRMLRILYALNGVWEGDFKWIKESTAAFESVPHRFPERVERLLGAPRCQEANEELASLLKEVLDLLPDSLDEAARIDRIRAYCASVAS